jgi:hypothetical protein
VHCYAHRKLPICFNLLSRLFQVILLLSPMGLLGNYSVKWVTLYNNSVIVLHGNIFLLKKSCEFCAVIFVHHIQYVNWMDVFFTAIKQDVLDICNLYLERNKIHLLASLVCGWRWFFFMYNALCTL